MKPKLLLFSIFFTVATGGIFASGHFCNYQDPLLKTHITQTRHIPDKNYQSELRNGTSWTNFLVQHPNWWVEFNEQNQKPARAVGSPIVVNVFGTPKDKALAFINSNLQAFNIPVNDLILRSTNSTNKHTYVKFYQTYQGMEVLWSNVNIKMLKSNNGVILFGLHCFSDIQIGIQPAIDGFAAKHAAEAGVYGVSKSTLGSELKILPIPGNQNYQYRLVYEVTVENKDAENVPGKYYTLVDAISGEILYRENKVAHFATSDITLTANITPVNSYQPNANLPVQHALIVENSNAYFTDNTGFVSLPNITPSTATLSLEGLFSTTKTNGVIPTWSTTVNPGTSNLSFDTHANIKELSAYNSVNDIHAYLNAKVPSFTGLDYSIVTNIDVAGSCNAFYNGELNFFDAGGACGATSIINDVVYHEYGHAINDLLYQSYGGNFGNGAMGEGYADTWANGLTNDPVLGIGFYVNDPTGYVRRYDINPKVYPQDLVGEVHADGEIIAGAWWDYGLNINNRQLAVDLFASTFVATISGAQGTEGQLYTDVLIEAITNDDNDGNLNNGTPHLSQLLSAFARHGITLLTNVSFTHNEVLSGADQTAIPINVTFSYSSQFPWFSASTSGFYKVNNQGSWTPFSLASTGGNNFAGSIPGQLAGDIISYYVAIIDGSGGVLQTLPAGVTDADPNIPYFVMVDFTPLLSDDMEGSTASWIAGLPTDDAATGLWEFNFPVGSFNNGVMCQTDQQHSPGGVICAITGNANPNDPIGTNDIDDGRTTLISPVFDLSTSINPGFSFYRWYTNDQGSNPKTDMWQVSISGDGSNWVPVELTRTPDHSWRRFALRVKDYISPTSTVSIRFIAEDSTANKGSLIEAALDDLVLYDATTTGIFENQTNKISLTLFPNPTGEKVSISWNQVKQENITFSLTDNLGQTILTVPENNYAPGSHLLNLPLQNYINGIYFLHIKGNNYMETKKLTILR